jgi:hypothetical protein
MDCHEALEILDASSAGAWDGEQSLADEARRHLSQCAQCQTAWPQCEQWGRKLAVAMQAVSPPPHLSERLHAMLPQPTTASLPERTRRWSRRLWGSAALTLVGAVVATLLWPAPQPALRLADLLPAVDADLETLPTFSGRFEPRLPKEWKPFFQLERSYVRGFPAEGQPQAGRVGLVPFQFPSRGGGQPLHGRLLILTRRQLDGGDVPTTGFSAAPVFYQSSGAAWLVWVEEDFVYACLVPSGPEDLQQFQKALSASRRAIG